MTSSNSSTAPTSAATPMAATAAYWYPVNNPYVYAPPAATAHHASSPAMAPPLAHFVPHPHAPHPCAYPLPRPVAPAQHATVAVAGAVAGANSPASSAVPPSGATGAGPLCDTGTSGGKAQGKAIKARKAKGKGRARRKAAGVDEDDATDPWVERCRRGVGLLLGAALSVDEPAYREVEGVVSASLSPSAVAVAVAGGKIQKKIVKRKRGCFKCDRDACGSVFGLRHNLLRHIRTIHEKKRPFRCPEQGCAMTFVQRFDLHTHLASVHRRRKDFVCHACHRAFSQRSNLLTHLRSCAKLLSHIRSCSTTTTTTAATATTAEDSVSSYDSSSFPSPVTLTLPLRHHPNEQHSAAPTLPMAASGSDNNIVSDENKAIIVAKTVPKRMRYASSSPTTSVANSVAGPRHDNDLSSNVDLEMGDSDADTEASADSGAAARSGRSLPEQLSAMLKLDAGDADASCSTMGNGVDVAATYSEQA